MVTSGKTSLSKINVSEKSDLRNTSDNDGRSTTNPNLQHHHEPSSPNIFRTYPPSFKATTTVQVDKCEVFGTTAYSPQDNYNIKNAKPSITSRLDGEHCVQEPLSGTETPGIFCPSFLKQFQSFGLSDVKEIENETILGSPICNTPETYDERDPTISYVMNPFKRKASSLASESDSNMQETSRVILPLPTGRLDNGIIDRQTYCVLSLLSDPIPQPTHRTPMPEEFDTDDIYESEAEAAARIIRAEPRTDGTFETVSPITSAFIPSKSGSPPSKRARISDDDQKEKKISAGSCAFGTPHGNSIDILKTKN